MKLNKDFLKAVEGPIYSTWSAIASDAAELGPSSNSGNMELCLDANRMVAYGGKNGKAADDLVGEACKEHGYVKVSRFLCKHIKL